MPRNALPSQDCLALFLPRPGSSFAAMIAIRYHPILAFALFYVPGLLLFVAVLGLVGAVSPAVGGYLHRIANIVPLLIAAFAAWRSAKANGAPIYRFFGHNPSDVRSSFRKNIWLYAVAFGVFAVLSDLTMVVIATLAGVVESFHYSILRLWGLAAVYTVVTKLAIEHSFSAPGALDSEEAKNSGNARAPLREPYRAKVSD